MSLQVAYHYWQGFGPREGKGISISTYKPVKVEKLCMNNKFDL